MRRLGWPRLLWLVAALAAGVIVARAHYTADLSAFLPATPNPAQRLLVAQLKDGPASRVVLAAIEGGDAALRARLSKSLAAALRGDARFRAIQNGEGLANPADQDYVFRHRYLLSARIDAGFFGAEALQARIAETVELLSSPLGLMAKDLIGRDPTGETLDLIASFERPNAPATAEGVWVSRDASRALLVVELTASGSDTDGQQAALGAIRARFEALSPGRGAAADPVLRMTGPAVFAVEARSTIQHEAVRLSAISSALIVLFLLLVYRSWRLLLLGLVPVATGALAGVAAVALGFGTVHGVTLGFGVTLIGEAVDYSIYLFIQRAGPEGGGDARGWTREFWPTVRLGMLTSIVGFASLLPSSFPGLAQLGCYTIAGLVAAGLATRFVLPALVPAEHGRVRIDALGRVALGAIAAVRPLRPVLWLLPLAAGGALLAQGGALWNHELSALSPVPAAARSFDAALRADLGAADAGTLVVVSAPSAEQALAGAEATGRALGPLVGAGVIAGFDTPAQYLPSVGAQRARQAALPEPAVLRAAFAAAIRGLPLREERFTGFFEDVEAARGLPPVVPEDVAATSMGTAVRALLLRDGERWSALLPLHGVRPAAASVGGVDLGRMRAAVADVEVPGGSVVLLDLKREADALYGSYLAESVRLSLAGLGAILVLLAVSLRSFVRVLRVTLPLVLSVICVMSGFAWFHHPLTILHLVGLLLTVAVGSNYALFFDRNAQAGTHGMTASTVASLVVANLATVIGFAVLATSSVPVLADVGSTVAPGALLALVFSAMLAAPAPAPAATSTAGRP
jgi:predicted exporter